MAHPLQRTDGGAPVTLDDDTLAHMIAQARVDRSPAALQRVIECQGWQEGYIAMREWGVQLRASALEELARYRGLPVLDPRQGGVSARLVIQAAVSWLGMGYWEAPEVHAAVIQQRRRDLILCWIQFYPAQRQPYLCVREQHVADGANSAPTWFRAACLLGYYTRHRRIYSGNMPAEPLLGYEHMDKFMATWVHAFAKALLCLEEYCMDDYSCFCNETLRSIHAPVPEWAQPTGELNAKRLMREVQRQSGSPYVPPRRTGSPSRPLSEDSHQPWRVVHDEDEDGWDDDPPTEPVGPRSRP